MSQKIRSIQLCKFLEVNTSVQLLLPPKYSSPSEKDCLVQTELCNYFEDQLTSLIKSDENKKKFDLLRANLIKSGKFPLISANRQFQKKLLVKEILCLKSIVGFSINDWIRGTI